jgi:hypothetical protein
VTHHNQTKELTTWFLKGENHFFKKFVSNGFNILAVYAYSRSGVMHANIFWVSLPNNVGSKSFLNFFQNSNGHIP